MLRGMRGPASARRAAAAVTSLVVLLAAAPGAAQTLAPGVIHDEVVCTGDAEETYALYLPSDYGPGRPWSLLLGFHPGARGRAIVETYRAAAERYGFVVAASNTSRNGPWERSARAVRAMSKDVATRFTIDAARLYLTGHSGGARVAMEVAAGSKDIAGVIASSAGFGDARPRAKASFAIFATAGRDDFNYLEMRALDAALTTPHSLAVFDGGHTLPPAEVAAEAIAWLELQAMRQQRRPHDSALVARWLADRRTRLAATTDPLAHRQRLREFVADFDGLAEIDTELRALRTLEADPVVRKALADERAAIARERRLLQDALALEARLGDPEARTASLARLAGLLEAWSRAAAAEAPSAERSQARRLLGALGGGAAERTADDEYRALLQTFRGRR